jgi:hypothetical protein
LSPPACQRSAAASSLSRNTGRVGRCFLWPEAEVHRRLAKKLLEKTRERPRPAAPRFLRKLVTFRRQLAARARSVVRRAEHCRGGEAGREWVLEHWGWQADSC